MTCPVSYDPCDTRSRDHRTACIHGQCSQPRPPGLSCPYLPLGEHNRTNSLSQFLSKLHTHTLYHASMGIPAVVFCRSEVHGSVFPAERIIARHSTCTKNISVCTKVSTEKTRRLKRSPAERSWKDLRHRSPSYRPDVSCRSFKERTGGMKGNSVSLHSCEAWQRTSVPCHRTNIRFQNKEQAGEL